MQQEILNESGNAQHLPTNTVISRDSLNGIEKMNVEGEETYLGEVKNFKNNQFLAQVLPQDLSISWTMMPSGRELPAHFHPCSSLIVVAKGEGASTGDTRAKVSSGDIVYIPEWNLHGFKGLGDEGFTALSIQFQSDAIFSSEERPETSYIDRESIPLEKRQLTIVEREKLETLNEVELNGVKRNLGVLKNFSSDNQLKEKLPNHFCSAWVHLSSDEVLSEHIHEVDSMIIVTQGQGELLGAQSQNIKEGDIVFVPAGSHHGFKGSGEQGFWALSVQFQKEGLYENPDKPKVHFIDKESKKFSFEDFVNLNEDFKAEFKKNSIFCSSFRKKLEKKEGKKCLMDCLQVMSNSFQRLMFSRMALSNCAPYQKIFFEHLLEELGHDLELKRERESEDTLWDPILESTTSWFFAKNFLLDDPGRMVMTQMVLEGGASLFYSHFSNLSSEHISKHGVVDEGHDSLGIDLLKLETPEKLASLAEVLEQSWSMLNQFLKRTHEILQSID